MTKKYPGMASIIILVSLFLATTVMADSSQCLKCHKDLVDAAASKIVTHRPFSQQQCILCHSTENSVPTPAANQEDEWINNTNDVGKIEWLAESFDESTLQVALLPIDICNSDLTIKLWYHNHDKQQEIIHCPSNDSILTRLSPKQHPAVSQIQRQHYNDKLFTRVTLSWATNIPCRCQLVYLSDNNEYVEHEDDFYTTAHSQEIRNFNPDNTQVSIQCDDTFQRHTQVKSIPITALPEKTDQSKEVSSQVVTEFTTDFKRIGDSIEIVISTSQPAAIALGQNEVKTLPLPAPQQEPPASAATLPETSEHPPLAEEKQVNTAVCFQCHKETVEVASHPINVLAPPGMVIPPEYPLLSDGRMTCMTCHTRHSSNNEARLLKGGKKELCTGCHTNY